MGAGAPRHASVPDARRPEPPSVCRPEGRGDVDPSVVARERSHVLAALLPLARLHDGRGRLHRPSGVPVRPRHRPGLCLSQLRRGRRRRRGDDRHLRRQGPRELRPGGHARAHRQPHRRREPEEAVRQAARAEHRLLCRPPLLRIRRADHVRRRIGGAGAQPADQCARARSPLPPRPHRGDGLPGAVPVADRHRGDAAGGVRGAQAHQAGALDRAHAIRRRRRNPRSHAGDHPGFPHHQGVQPRGRHAGAGRRERRSCRGRLEQARPGVEPRDPA